MIKLFSKQVTRDNAAAQAGKGEGAGGPDKGQAAGARVDAAVHAPVDAPVDATQATPETQLGAGLSKKAGHALGSSGVTELNMRPLAETEMGLAGPKNTDARSILAALKSLPSMDREALRKKFHRPTTRMEAFLAEAIGKVATGEVKNGIPQFEVKKNSFPDDHVFEYRDYTLGEVAMSPYWGELHDKQRALVVRDYATPEGKELPPANDAVFRFTAKELRGWQESARTYYSPDHYDPKELSVALRGDREVPHEAMDKEGFDASVAKAFKAKFIVKMAEAPILCDTSGAPLHRPDPTKPLPAIWMGSQCGMDLDFRTHDRQDTLHYVVHKDGTKLSDGEAQEMEALRTAALGWIPSIDPYEAQEVLKVRLDDLKLDREAMIADAVKMKKLYMEAQVDAGVQVPVLVALGCGVFARWFNEVPEVMAEADRRVLTDPSWRSHGIRGVVYALPRFAHNGGEPFEKFQAIFKKDPPSNLPVIFADQDALTITRALADSGYKVSVQNPADSDLSAGEYWENRGPALEEWLALTTGMLLSQHAAINPRVTDPATLKPVAD